MTQHITQGTHSNGLQTKRARVGVAILQFRSKSGQQYLGTQGAAIVQNVIQNVEEEKRECTKLWDTRTHHDPQI